MLDDIAVLILVDKQPRVAGTDRLGKVANVQQLPGGLSNCRVVRVRLVELQDLRIVAASRRELGNETHREPVDSGDPIRGARNACSSQACAQSRNASVRVRQDEDGFVLRMRDERVSNQLRLPTTCGGCY